MNMGDFYQRIKTIQQFLSPENQAHRCHLCPKVCPAPAPKQAPWPLARRDREHVPSAASRLSGSRVTSNMGKPNSSRGWAAPGLVMPGITDSLLSTSKVYLQLALRSWRQSRRHQSAACSARTPAVSPNQNQWTAPYRDVMLCRTYGALQEGIITYKMEYENFG